MKNYNEDPERIVDMYLVIDKVTNTTAKEVVEMKRENRDIYDTSAVAGFKTIQVMIDSGILKGPNKTINSEVLYNPKWIKH